MANNSALSITSHQARRFSLTRQLLLNQRAEKPQEVVRRLIAIQAQYEATAPIAVWSRCPSVPPDWMEGALQRTKVLVKTWCLRGTVHIISSDDLAVFVHSIGGQHLADYFHFMETRRGIPRADLEMLHKQILKTLSSGPLSRSELKAAVPVLDTIRGSSWGLDVKGLAFTGDVVFADSQGRESRFARRDRWLPAKLWNEQSEEAALGQLLNRYLFAYSPATLRDFAHWSGLKMARVRRAHAARKQELMSVEVEGWPGLHYALAEDEAELRQVGNSNPHVCVLPKFDPLMMAYAYKLRYIPEDHVKRVYRPAGQVEAVILLAGEVRATWRMQKRGTGATVTVDPFSGFKPKERLEINDKVTGAIQNLGLAEIRLSFE